MHAQGEPGPAGPAGPQGPPGEVPSGMQIGGPLAVGTESTEYRDMIAYGIRDPP